MAPEAPPLAGPGPLAVSLAASLVSRSHMQSLPCPSRAGLGRTQSPPLPPTACATRAAVSLSAMTMRGRRSRDCWDYAARLRPPFSGDSEEIKHQQHCF